MDTKKLFGEIRTELYQKYGARITKKSNNPRFWGFLANLLRIVSFGKNTDFMLRTTTLGKVVAFGTERNIEDPSIDEVLTLVHEGVHLRQFHQYGFWMVFLYLFCPLPIFLAYYRYKFELDAFVAEYRFAEKSGLLLDPNDIISYLSGPSYFWAWPKKWVRKDVDRFLG